MGYFIEIIIAPREAATAKGYFAPNIIKQESMP